jgi:hypothetical protein
MEFLESAFNTISRRSFLAESYKNPVLHPIMVEMIHSRDSTVYHFDPNDASLLYGTVHSRIGVRQGDLNGPLLFNLAITAPLLNIGERCKDLPAIQALSNGGKYLIKTPFIPTVTAVATEELGKGCSRVQPIKSSCTVPLHTTHELVEMKRAKIPVVTGTSTQGAPLAMDFPPASHNENHVHSWLQDSVEAHQLLFNKIVSFATSDFRGTHASFRLMITCEVRRYELLLRTPPEYLPTVPCSCR